MRKADEDWTDELMLTRSSMRIGMRYTVTRDVVCVFLSSFSFFFRV